MTESCHAPSSDAGAASKPARRPASFWAALVLAGLLSASLLGNLALLRTSASERSFDEVVLEGEAESEHKILSVPLTGLIMEGRGSSDPVSSIRTLLRKARKDQGIKGIVLEVDSPGGGVASSDVLYHELARFRQERGIPIVTLCRSLNASGGYYASMASSHIVASEASLVGSIGVIAQLPNFTAAMHHLGIGMNTIKSKRPDGSESFKDLGSPYRPMRPAERRIMQESIQRMWSRFVDVVAEGRKGKLTRAQVAGLADGRIYTGRDALALHLIDSLGYREDAWHKAQELAQAPKARLVTWKARSPLLGELLGTHTLVTSAESTLHELTAPLCTSGPQLLYLWSSP